VRRLTLFKNGQFHCAMTGIESVLIHHDGAARSPAGWSASFSPFQVRQNIQTAVPE
jgi:hypothetical protein